MYGHWIWWAIELKMYLFQTIRTEMKEKRKIRRKNHDFPNRVLYFWLISRLFLSLSLTHEVEQSTKSSFNFNHDSQNNFLKLRSLSLLFVVMNMPNFISNLHLRIESLRKNILRQLLNNSFQNIWHFLFSLLIFCDRSKHLNLFLSSHKTVIAFQFWF